MEGVYQLGNEVVYDSDKNCLKTLGDNIYLGSREAKLLDMLCQNPNEVINKEDIQDYVWGSVIVGETSITKAVSNLRKLMSSIQGMSCNIKTVPKHGYMLINDVYNTEDIQQPGPIIKNTEFNCELKKKTFKDTFINSQISLKTFLCLSLINCALSVAVTYIVMS